MPSYPRPTTRLVIAWTCWLRVVGLARMPAITSLPVPSVMLGSTGRPWLRSDVTATVRLPSVPLVAIRSAATALKPNGDTSPNTLA